MLCIHIIRYPPSRFHGFEHAMGKATKSIVKSHG